MFCKERKDFSGGTKLREKKIDLDDAHKEVFLPSRAGNIKMVKGSKS